MVAVKIYIEGGGEGKHLEIVFQRAWTKFFQAAGLQGCMPRSIRGKGRKNTHDLFCTAFKNRQPSEAVLLLLDSETPVQEGDSVWQHLKKRDQMEPPAGADDQNAYLMAQVMEMWLLADPKALQNYFGSKFKTNKIPDWRDLEAQPKQAVFDALDNATAECEKQYAKGKISFDALSGISPKLVAEKCPHAKRLLDFLAKQL
jgi:hypothetical protein